MRGYRISDGQSAGNNRPGTPVDATGWGLSPAPFNRVGTGRIVVGVFADANARRAKDAGRLRIHQVRLKPALRLFEMSPVGVSLTEPVTLNGPPNSFCSALSVRSHLSSMLEMRRRPTRSCRWAGY